MQSTLRATSLSQSHRHLALQISSKSLPRRNIHMSALDDVVAAREQDHESEQETAPVHAIRCHGHRAREECEYQDREQPAQCCDVDRHPCFAKRPLAMGDRLASQALEQQAPNGQNVRGEQGGQVEGQDSVEGGSRANVNQRK